MLLRRFRLRAETTPAVSRTAKLIDPMPLPSAPALFKFLRAAALVAGMAALVLVLNWLPSWGSGPESDGREVVEVWGWSIAAESLDLLVPAFQRTQPEVDVRVTRSGANLQSRFLLGLAAGVGAPDISQLQEREAAKFTATGRLLDLTDLAGRYAEEFSPAFWASGLHEGRVYSIPWDMGPCAVFYKRWIFERYGIDPESIETWDDFIAVGTRLREASGGATAMLPLTLGGLTDLFQILMQQNGGGIFNQAGEIILDSPENVAALDLIRRLVDSGVTTPLGGPELLASLGADSVACYPAAVWFMNQIKDNTPAARVGQWGVFRLPAFAPGGLRTSNLGGSVLVIPEQSEQGLAAWRFVEFANCTVEGQVAQYREKGLFPAYLPALQHPYFSEPDSFFGGQPVHRLFATDLELIPPLIRTKDWNEAERMLGQTLSRWLTRRQDHRTYLQTLAANLSRKVGRPVAEGAAE
jgi:lactose/L-arabinose transport system substrate-binding protein